MIKFARARRAAHLRREDIMPLRSYVSRSALLVFVFAALSGSTTAGAQTPVAVPDSPPGALLKQWLTAFNNGDSVALEEFSKAHFPRQTTQAYMQLSRRSGGLELVRIISAGPSRIVFAARTRSTKDVLRGKIELADDNSSQVKSFGLQGVPAGASLEGCSTYASPSTHGVSAADVASEEAIVAALYDVISGPACQHRDWDRERGLFAPGARLIPTQSSADGTRSTQALTPDEYAARVKDSMEEFGFFENEVSHVGESFNGVVHRFSTYESRRAANDATPFARGINSIQLLNDGKRWWVVTVYWASERPGAPIPEMYLKRP
jgi:hypothetical protein